MSIHLSFLLLGFCMILNINMSAQKARVADGGVIGIYEASTPCGESARPLHEIPKNAACEFMIWRLTLYGNASSQQPSSYTLSAKYGMTLPGTPDIKGGGTEIKREGSVKITKGTRQDEKAIVYELVSDNKMPSIHFVKLTDQLLHLLDQEKNLMIGNAGFSYTLNKTK